MSDWGPYQYLSGQIANAQAATVRITFSTAVMISERFAITAAHSPLDKDNKVTPNLTVQNLWGEIRKIVNVLYVVNEDFAIVELESPFEHSYAVKLAESSSKPGDRIFQVGHPGVVANSGIGWAVSFGLDYEDKEEPWIDVFDIPTSGGNSGGGIYNERGELIGIASVGYPGNKISPWFKETFSVSNGIEPINSGWLNGSINLSFIKNFLAQHNIKNTPVSATETDLPKNLPDPGKILLEEDVSSKINSLASEDRKSSVLISNAGAADSKSSVFASGGSGTVIHDGLVLTVMHALDNRPTLSIGYYSGEVDGKALAFSVSRFGDFGLVKRMSETKLKYSEQEIAVTSMDAGDPAYLIGSPRKYWLSEGGWIVSGAVARNNQSVESGAWDSGGASGGGIFNMSSDITGVFSTYYGPSPSGARESLIDRQDSHSTAYAPAILDNKSLPVSASSEFFFLKQFVSEHSPSSMNTATNAFFSSGAREHGGLIYEWGWHNQEGKNAGYVRRHLADGMIDKNFASEGLFKTGLGTYNEQVKAVFVSDGYVTIFGECTRDGVQNLFQARLTLKGEIDKQWGINGFKYFESKTNQSLNAVASHEKGYILAGTQFSSEGLDAFTMRVDDKGLDTSYGQRGVSLLKLPNSSEMSSDIIVHKDGVYLLVNSDRLGPNGDWDALVLKLNHLGNIDTAFGKAGFARIDYKDKFNFGIKLLDVNDGLVVAGHTYYSSDESTLLAKISYDGKLIDSFGNGGTAILAFDNDSSYLVVDAVFDGNIKTLVAAKPSLISNQGMSELKTDYRVPVIIGLSGTGEFLSASVAGNFTESTYPTHFIKNLNSKNFLIASQDRQGYTSNLWLGNNSDSGAPLSLPGEKITPSSRLPGQTLIGTDRGELIDGEGVADKIYGLGGDDRIYSGRVPNGVYIDGGLGNDSIWGSKHADTLVGGGGFDFLFGGEGDDLLIASPEGGEFLAWDGEDTAQIPYSVYDFGRFDKADTTDKRSSITIYLKSNPDLIYHVNDVEKFVFNDWSGTFAQLAEKLTLPKETNLKINIHPYLDAFSSYSDSVNITLTTGIAHNTISLRGGNDVVDAGWGDDIVFTNNGNDTITGGRGNDTIDGGPGIDTAVYLSKFSEITFIRNGTDVIVKSKTEGKDTLKNIEYVRVQGIDYKLSDSLHTGGPEKLTLTAQVKSGSVVIVDTKDVNYVGVFNGVSESNLQAIHRFYNTRDKAFFYTVDSAEKNVIISNSTPNITNAWANNWPYVYQGSTFEKAHSYSGGTPLYRFYNRDTGHHFFTVSKAEADAVRAKAASGEWPFNYEGTAFNVYANDPTPNTQGQEIAVHRFYSSQLNRHFYTASDTEVAEIKLSGQWAYEGIGFWGEIL